MGILGRRKYLPLTGVFKLNKKIQGVLSSLKRKMGLNTGKRKVRFNVKHFLFNRRELWHVLLHIQEASFPQSDV